MELKSIIKKNTDIIIIGEITKIIKYNSDLGLTELLSIPVFDGVKSILNINEDVYLIIEQGNFFDVLRIGTPLSKMIIKDTQSRSFKEYDINGTLINTSNSVNIIDDYYTVDIFNQSRKGYFENSGYKLPFDLNYMAPKEPTSNTDGYSADGVFVDVGFGTFGYIGKKNSYFDIDAGIWIEDSTRIAKASDIAMAACKKYNLNWYDNTSSEYIQNYIKYFRSYDEENGVFRVYSPGDMFAGGTPLDDLNNFQLIREDEFGNTYISGVDMLTLQELETAPEGSKGIHIPYV